MFTQLLGVPQVAELRCALLVAGYGCVSGVLRRPEKPIEEGGRYDITARGCAWIGVDIGKTHHWICAIDDKGQKLLPLKVLNDETQILEVITAVSGLADSRVWVIDIFGTPSALLVALLAQAGEQVRYAPGRVVAVMSTAYTGEGKTDAKDAYVIAETARIRTDLVVVVDTNTDMVRSLGVLTGHRTDLVADRVRMIERLRDLLTSVFPALEREFDFASCKGSLVLLTGYATRRQSAEWAKRDCRDGYASVRSAATPMSQHEQ